MLTIVIYIYIVGNNSNKGLPNPFSKSRASGCGFPGNHLSVDPVFTHPMITFSSCSAILDSRSDKLGPLSRVPGAVGPFSVVAAPAMT